MHKTKIRAVTCAFFEYFIIEITVNYFAYGTVDILNLKVIIYSLLYGCLAGITSFYYINEQLSIRNQRNIKK